MPFYRFREHNSQQWGPPSGVFGYELVRVTGVSCAGGAHQDATSQQQSRTAAFTPTLPQQAGLHPTNRLRTEDAAEVLWSVGRHPLTLLAE
jgi:hypothetical protein